MNKVVLSRIHQEPIPDNFQLTSYFRLLCDLYPDAFTYVLCIPETGCWCGASPEPLLTVSGGNVETISLAGTQKYDPRIQKPLWDAKELEEQQIVTSYIA